MALVLAALLAACTDLAYWDAAAGWQVELVRVDYDIVQEQAALAQRKPPKWQSLSRTLDGEHFLG